MCGFMWSLMRQHVRSGEVAEGEEDMEDCLGSAVGGCIIQVQMQWQDHHAGYACHGRPWKVHHGQHLSCFSA